MKLDTRIGFHGKLPIVGDFVSRRLPREFIDSWDGWLQSAISASREQLGDDWLKSYLTSPIWRFLLSPGLCGTQAVAGIMMPSVDRVGRYYPLTVAALFEPSPQLPFLFTSGNIWFEQIEDVALSGLEGNLDVDAFDQLMQTLPPFILPTSSFREQQSPAETKVLHIAMENIESIATAFVELNANLLATFMPGYSLWCSAGSEHVEPALLACQGLPPIGSFFQFLKGNNRPMNCEVKAKQSEATEPEHPSLSSILAGDKPSLNKSGWRSWAVTDTGKRRQHNEDSLLARPEAGLWVVADGMGGHKAGDVASQLIVNTLKDLSLTQPLENCIREVTLCLQKVNTQLRELASKEYGNHLVGSTVVALVCESRRCGFLWAGDSRLYRFRNKQLLQLTQDHCAADEVSSSEWSVKSSNVITRAVGAYEELELDVAITDVLEGDVFLLCSDGLDKELSLKEIEHIMQITTAENIAQALLSEALSCGGRDNITVIVVTAAILTI